MKRLSLLFVVAMILVVLPLHLYAQEDDGRINMRYWMDGFGVYCIGADGAPADSYVGGGFLVLAPSDDGGKTIISVSEATIEEAIAEARASGTYATVAVAAADAWFSPAPAIYYHPDSGEFQLNVAKSSPDDLRHGKLYAFRWKDCQGITTG